MTRVPTHTSPGKQTAWSLVLQGPIRLSSPSSGFQPFSWKNGNNLTVLTCPALPQLARWGKTPLLLCVGNSHSESFLTARRPKEDPVSLNWLCRPPLTSSPSFRWQFAISQTVWAGGLRVGEFCTFASAMWAAGLFWVEVMWSHFGGRGQKGYGRGWGECGSRNSFFLFPFSSGWAIGNHLGAPGYF